MMQFIVNSMEESNYGKFILSTGFSSKDEMIAYLKNENSTNVSLPVGSFNTAMNVVSNPIYLAVYLDEEFVLLNYTDVCFMEASLRKTKIYTETDVYTSNKPLHFYEHKLLETSFFRSHKSFLINIEKVDRCVQMVNYNYEVIFKNTVKRAEISRPKVKSFKKLIEL